MNRVVIPAATVRMFEAQSQAATRAPVSGRTCAKRVAIGAVAGAAAGLAGGFALLAAAGGSDSFGAILRHTTVLGLGIGFFAGAYTCGR